MSLFQGQINFDFEIQPSKSACLYQFLRYSLCEYVTFGVFSNTTYSCVRADNDA